MRTLDGAFVVATLLLAGRAAADEPTLVADLNPEILDLGASDVSTFARVNGHTVFTAAGAVSRHLWRTDGSAAGTELLRNLSPPPFGSGFTTFLGSNDRSLFMAVQDGEGLEQRPWVTDGTVSGTRLLAPVTIPMIKNLPHLLEPQTGNLYFFAQDEAGLEPWVSDGTPDGTHRIADTMGPFRPFFRSLTALAGQAAYIVSAAGIPEQIWVTDGTTTGTRRVDHVNAVLFGPRLFAHGGRLLFPCTSPATHLALCVSDGTAAGTKVLWDPVPGADEEADLFVDPVSGSSSGALIVLSRGSTRELWRTDGTPAGTVRILTHAAGSDLLFPSLSSAPGAIDGRAIFLRRMDTGACELWGTDGSVPGTVRLGGFVGRICQSQPFVFTTFAGDLLLSGEDEAHGNEVWATNGRPGSLRLFADFCPGQCSSSASGGWVHRGAVYWRASGDGQLPQLWRSDGTTAGTIEVTSLPDLGVRDAISVPSGELLLSLTTAGRGTELWITNGNPGGTRLVTDFAPPRNQPSNPTFFELNGRLLIYAYGGEQVGFGLWSSDGSPGSAVRITPPRVQAFSFARLGQRALFRANAADAATDALWVTDGTAGGTRPIFPLSGLRACGPIALGAMALFFLQGNGPALDLWASDGTPTGTRRVATGVGKESCDAADAHALGGRLYFLGEGGFLWETDGTAAGTRRFLALTNQVRARRDGQMATAGGKLYFLVETAELDLWVTDGTAGGTRKLKTVVPRNLLNASFLFPEGDVLYFDSRDPDTGLELWRTEGTAETTRIFYEFEPGPASSRLLSFAFVGERMFASVFDREHGYELWLSDGTDAGTERVADLEPGALSSRPLFFLPAGGGVVFTAIDSHFGTELWVSDGTAAGTERLTDLAPGPAGSDPYPIAIRDGRIFFAGNDLKVGTELRSLPLPAVTPPCTTPSDLCLRNQRVRLRTSFRDPRTGKLGKASAVPFSDRSGFFWFFNPENIELVAKVLDGGAVNGHWWSFYGALSDVEYWVEVMDLDTGQRQTYHNERRNLCGLGDTRSIPVEARRSELVLEEQLPAAQERGSCGGDGDTLCLLDSRFAVEVDWRNQRTGETGRGGALPGTDQTGYFWFFSPANVELVVKMLDGTAVNGHLWVFYGALSDVEYTITVTDTTTGEVSTYHNPPGNLCGQADVVAF